MIGTNSRRWLHRGKTGVSRQLYPVPAGFVLAILISVGGGCTSAPQLRERLRVEFGERDFLMERTTNVTGRITFAEAGRRWAERDPEIMQQVARTLSESIDVAEAKSWIWPRADVEFRAITARDRNSGLVRSAPSGGLVLNYDFKKLLFHADAAAVSAAGRDLCLQRARLAIDAAMVRLEGLVIDWYHLREAVPLEDQRGAEFRRLIEAIHSLDQLGALPAGSFAEWKHREQVALRERSEATRRLESIRQSLRTELGLAGEAEPDLGSVDFLLNVPPSPEGGPGAAEVHQWLPAVWQSHPACRIAELELFQAEMAVIQAKRERLPRLTGSIGLGNLDTWVGNEIVEANGVAEIGVTMPLFDAGTISRGIEKAGLRRDLARRNVRILARSLTREVQSALASRCTTQLDADHRRAECEEVRRLAEVAGRGATLGQGDPLLPFALRVYRVEADLGALGAKMKLAKAWLAYRAALGEQPVPGLSSSILDGLVRDLGKTKGMARK